VDSDDMEYTEDAIDNMILEFLGDSKSDTGEKKQQMIVLIKKTGHYTYTCTYNFVS
jgi:hypothetical protein